MPARCAAGPTAVRHISASSAARFLQSHVNTPVALSCLPCRTVADAIFLAEIPDS